MSNPNLTALSEAGVSIWLDDLSRERLKSGNLAELVATKNVVGVTTNPTIFAGALSKGESYDEQVRELAARGASTEATVKEITTTDVRTACDLFRDVYASTDGVDGRVSLEVDPRLAGDTDATIAEALDLWKTVDRPNLMVKIPATVAKLPYTGPDLATSGASNRAPSPRTRVTTMAPVAAGNTLVRRGTGLATNSAAAVTRTRNTTSAVARLAPRRCSSSGRAPEATVSAAIPNPPTSTTITISTTLV